MFHFHESDYHDFHDADHSNYYKYSNNSNYSKDSNIRNNSTDTNISSRNLEDVMDKSKYVVFHNTITCNQDLTTF